MLDNTHRNFSRLLSEELDIPLRYTKLVEDSSIEPNVVDTQKLALVRFNNHNYVNGPAICGEYTRTAYILFNHDQFQKYFKNLKPEQKIIKGYKYFSWAIHHLIDLMSPYHTMPTSVISMQNHDNFEKIVDGFWSDEFQIQYIVAAIYDGFQNVKTISKKGLTESECGSNAVELCKRLANNVSIEYSRLNGYVEVIRLSKEIDKSTYRGYIERIRNLTCGFFRQSAYYAKLLSLMVIPEK